LKLSQTTTLSIILHAKIKRETRQGKAPSLKRKGASDAVDLSSREVRIGAIGMIQSHLEGC
jgi:hypothetical protein